MKKKNSSIGILLTLLIVAGFVFNFCSSQGTKQRQYEDHFANGIQRTWIGPGYWANRLQDWQLNKGRIECLVSNWNRNVNLLTQRLENTEGSFSISTDLGLITDTLPQNNKNWAGFRLGARGQFHDYRDDAIYGKGLNVGITSKGDLFIGEPPVKNDKNASILVPFLKKNIRLAVAVENNDGKYNLKISATDPATGKVLKEIRQEDVPSQYLYGSIALVSNFPEVNGHRNLPSCWFDNLQLSGSKVASSPEHAFGPILFSQYTLSKRIMKMTAQMPPLGKQDDPSVRFQLKENKGWKTLQTAQIDPDAHTAIFRIENWNDKEDVPYRLAYTLHTGANTTKEYYHTGTIRKDPVGKDEIVVAAFTGNNDLGFPNTELSEAIKKINPDLLFFSGDQIYETVGGFGVQRSPVDKAMLDYLRKWYLYGWEYGDLLKDIPAISIPDDHDMYHGNLWGAGGKATPPGLTGQAAQDAGGYKMSPRWVNMVQRTQTGNLPDPYDPTPVLQGITVYYTELNVGGVSFAVLEDRKFKSAPKSLLPEAHIVNGWPHNKRFNAATASDVPEATLLGKRQLDFLNDWAQDWRHHTWMKGVLSQTIWENMATLPKNDFSDAVVPKLRIMKPGEYPPDDRPVSDFDSDGWPQTGRKKAVSAIRKAFAMHISGDQHLGSTSQYGVDDWRDASYTLCVPSISNYWPRRWYPSVPGKNRKPGSPKYTGDFLDGFGNKMTVYAVSNPVYTGKKPSNLYDRAAGYGIVRFHRDTRNIDIQCWPRFEDPTAPDAKEYAGWPITINQLDNYNRKAYGWLPEVRITGMKDPVIKLYKEDTNNLVYALRIKGNTFDPRVFEAGAYRLVIGDEGNFKTYKGLTPEKEKGKKSLHVKF